MGNTVSDGKREAQRTEEWHWQTTSDQSNTSDMTGELGGQHFNMQPGTKTSKFGYVN